MDKKALAIRRQVWAALKRAGIPQEKSTTRLVRKGNEERLEYDVSVPGFSTLSSSERLDGSPAHVDIYPTNQEMHERIRTALCDFRYEEIFLRASYGLRIGRFRIWGARTDQHVTPE